MNDRATYLARTLLRRVRSASAASLDDPSGEVAPDSAAHEELVEKVLAVEVGVTDGARVRRLVNALPASSPAAPPSERELAELAAFLRTHFPEIANA